MVGYVIITLLQTVREVCQRKNLENRSIIGKDMDKRKVPRFFGPPRRTNIKVNSDFHPSGVCKSSTIVTAIACNNVYGVVFVAGNCHYEISPGSFGQSSMSARRLPTLERQAAADLWTRPTDLNLRSTKTGSYSTTLTIPIYYYSARKLVLILPFHRGQKAEST